MCCRYYVNAGLYEEVKDVTGDDAGASLFREGDIRPSGTAPVILAQSGRLQLSGMRWGLPLPDPVCPSGSASRGKLLINARAETLLQKPVFAPLARSFRCIIPAGLFYEWNARKEKVSFSPQEGSLLCMAGIYRPGPEGLRFVIITTDANDSMRPVHDRMPLIFPKDMAASWIRRADKVEDMLKQKSPELKRMQEYQQLSLF